MNKVNLCWVLSDNRKGHEIQSLALSSLISRTTEVYHFSIQQPWRIFTPYTPPFFSKSLKWLKQAPNLNNQNEKPDILITCGKRAAAVGKYLSHQIKKPHIQILNPQDKPNNYDILITPEHDQIKGPNIINIKGSLHHMHHLNRNKNSVKNHEQKNKKTVLAIMLANPGQSFYRELNVFLDSIRQNFKKYDIYLCGSRRVPDKYRNLIRQLAKTYQINVWLDENDGDNPYLGLLLTANHLLISADSINMISEGCATDKAVSVFAYHDVSKKHQRYIDSLKDRITPLFQFPEKPPTPINEMNHLIKHPLLVNLIDSILKKQTNKF